MKPVLSIASCNEYTQTHNTLISLLQVTHHVPSVDNNTHTHTHTHTHTGFVKQLSATRRYRILTDTNMEEHKGDGLYVSFRARPLALVITENNTCSLMTSENTASPCFTPLFFFFCSKGPCQLTPLLNLCPLVIGLTRFGCLAKYYPETPLHFGVIFLFSPIGHNDILTMSNNCYMFRHFPDAITRQ